MRTWHAPRRRSATVRELAGELAGAARPAQNDQRSFRISSNASRPRRSAYPKRRGGLDQQRSVLAAAPDILETQRVCLLQRQPDRLANHRRGPGAALDPEVGAVDGFIAEDVADDGVEGTRWIDCDGGSGERVDGMHAA